MSSDRARISYDATRRYHAVVKQQGRVTLEADDNEGYDLIGESLRSDALDFVGPSGTPDDGYAVSDGLGPHDFHIGAGTLYVGGMRVTLPAQIRYGAQDDWVDHAGDPEWIDPAQGAPGGQSHEYIYLFLREQEVSAVEDTALREVALGGPDTAQRLRLIQRVMRLGTDASDCPGALATAKTHWAALGLTFDEQTMRLESTGRLQADFESPGAAPEPCEPQAHGGYLGADNQLIRVQVSAAGKFLWGFDNASFLYRVTVIDSQTLELQSSPVDSFHFPRAGQAVEVLRTAAKLSDTDYVASATGVVQTLAAPYAPDTRRITLPAPLPAEYLNAAETPMVFLRVWEEEKAFAAGTAVSLGTTGLQVTLSGGAPFHVGDYWMIAVRPSTSNEVYPHRYLDAPQPPDGPRLWACPLAVVDWSSGAFQLLANCREPFDNLVELTKRKGQGCCTVTVGDGVNSVGQFTDIQQAVETAAALGRAVRVCILAGEYRLREPVVIRGDGITVSGCGMQTRILGPDGDAPAFVVQEAARITLESLWVQASSRQGVVLAIGTQMLRVADCRIANGTDVEGLAPAVLVRAGGGEVCRGLTVVDNDLRGLPAVAFQAESVRVIDNRMLGGVWVREGSEDVLLRENEMVKGDGPGVLLGGLLQDEHPPDQLAGISRVEIVGNHIESMTASGITTFVRSEQPAGEAASANPFAAAAQPGQWSLIEDLTIAHNRIVGCVRGFDGVFDPDAAGGIVLRQVAGLRVRSNTITNNGARSNTPACGVFLYSCLGPEVTDNTIVGNGGEQPEGEGHAYQGGIVGLLLFAGVLQPEQQGHGLQPGGPAAVIHGNTVDCPGGQALILAAAGSVSVADNALTSREAVDQPEPLLTAGRCCYIFDLGQASGYAAGLAGFGVAEASHVENAGLAGDTISLKFGAQASGYPDGRVLLHGNQITLRIARELPAGQTNAAVAVVSTDDISFQDNQVLVEAANGLGVSVITAGVTVRATGNRISELPLRAVLSYFSWALRDIATSNQATHCILVIGPEAIETDNHVLVTVFCKLFAEWTSTQKG